MLSGGIQCCYNARIKASVLTWSGWGFVLFFAALKLTIPEEISWSFNSLLPAFFSYMNAGKVSVGFTQDDREEPALHADVAFSHHPVKRTGAFQSGLGSGLRVSNEA